MSSRATYTKPLWPAANIDSRRKYTICADQPFMPYELWLWFSSYQNNRLFFWRVRKRHRTSPAYSRRDSKVTFLSRAPPLFASGDPRDGCTSLTWKYISNKQYLIISDGEGCRTANQHSIGTVATEADGSYEGSVHQRLQGDVRNGLQVCRMV